MTAKYDQKQMTKPTPAQIEAAIGAYGVVLSQAFTNDGAPPSVLRNAMSAALTAAAEVGETNEFVQPKSSQTIPVTIAAAEYDPYTQPGDPRFDGAEVSASAEVVESVPSAWLPPEKFKLAAEVDVDPSSRFIIEADHDVIAVTIERCAQVAESFNCYHAYDAMPAEIAAAIRALGDKK